MADQLVHRPDGFAPSGPRQRAVCSCGWSTSPRSSEERALATLESEHGHSWPVCALCGKDYDDLSLTWQQLRDQLEILTDPDGKLGQVLVCRGMPSTCLDAAAQRQVHLDRAAFDDLGMEAPRPRLRVVEGGQP